MTARSPNAGNGVYVSQDRINEFVSGIFGQNKMANRAAGRNALKILVGAYAIKRVRGK